MWLAVLFDRHNNVHCFFVVSLWNAGWIENSSEAAYLNGWARHQQKNEINSPEKRLLLLKAKCSLVL